MNNVSLIIDDKASTVSIRVNNLAGDHRLSDMIDLLIDSGFWVKKEQIVQGERTIWIKIKT